MNGKDAWQEFKCFGSATVGPRGQVVIPASARKELAIETGTTLLAFQGPGGKGLLLLKADTIEELVQMVNEGLVNIRKLVRKDKPRETAARNNREGIHAKEA